MLDSTIAINELSILLGLNKEKIASLKINYELLENDSLLLYSKLKNTEYVDSVYSQEKLENEKAEGLIALRVEDDLNEELHNERSLFSLVKHKNIDIKTNEKVSSSLLQFVSKADSPNFFFNTVLNMSSQFVNFIIENSSFDIKKGVQNISKSINTLYQNSIENHKKQQNKQKKLQLFMISKQKEREQKRILKIEKQQQEAEEKINKKTKNKQKDNNINNTNSYAGGNNDENYAQQQQKHNKSNRRDKVNDVNSITNTITNTNSENPKYNKSYNSNTNNNKNYENEKRQNKDRMIQNTDTNNNYYVNENVEDYNDGTSLNINPNNNNYNNKYTTNNQSAQSNYYGNGQNQPQKSRPGNKKYRK